MFAPKYLHPEGPATYIRRISLQLGYYSRLADQFGDPDNSKKRALFLLLEGATALEQLTIFITSPPAFQRDGIWFKNISEHSWIDPPMNLPPDPMFRVESTSGLGGTSTIVNLEDLQPALDFLAGHDNELKARIIHRIEQEGPPSRPDGYGYFYRDLWTRIWTWEGEKTFWGGEVLELLKELSPTVREIRIEGRHPDWQWMGRLATARGEGMRVGMRRATKHNRHFVES